MSTLTKARAKKPARPARKSATNGKRLVFRPDLPTITPESPLYGADDLVGCVNIGLPSDKESRRKHIRARIHADNNNS
jgi:hypothetical protein